MALESQQIPIGLGLLLWLPLWLGLGSETSIWFVPLLGLMGAVVALGISAGVLIFSLLVVFGVTMALSIIGSILGWGWGKTLTAAAWFSSLAFVAMHSVIWLFDGSNAYGGGGIVVSFSTVPLVLRLGLGLLAVTRGVLAYGQLEALGLSKAQQGLYLGGGGAGGLLLGYLAGATL